MKQTFPRQFVRHLVVEFVAVAITATAALPQTYTALPLPPPSGYFFNYLYGSVNNKGQVLGEAETGFNNGVGRAPVLWTNGVPQILPIPSGYAFTALIYSYHVNDAGTVIGTVQETHSTRTHIAIWTGGVPAVLDEIQSQICPNPKYAILDLPSTYSSGFNSAGHIVGATSYPPVDPNNGLPCTSSWFWNGVSFSRLPNPIPPACKANETDILRFPTLNDADQVMDNVENFFCSNSPYFIQPVVMYPPSFTSVAFIPEGAFKSFTAGYINNLGMISGCISCGSPTSVGVWDANHGLRSIGANTGYQSGINNLGQVAYASNPSSPSAQIESWQNGSSTPIQLPQGVPSSVLPTAINDVGQIAVSSQGIGGWLLTPAGPCATDASSQVRVTRSGFRYNRSNQHFTQLVTVTNTSGITLNGPISVAFDNVPAAASLFGVSGATSCNSPAGSPYVNGTAPSLAGGASTTLTLDFIDTAQTGITYATRVLVGPGRR